MTETEIALLNALENLERNRKATEQQILSELEKLAGQHKAFEEQLLTFSDALQELCLFVNGVEAMQQESIQTLKQQAEIQKKQSKVLSELKG